MIILISPAKKLDCDTPAPTKKFNEPLFETETKTLLKDLKKCSAKDLSQLMKLSDKLAELNKIRYDSFKFPFNLKNSKQAMFAFQGDTYVGLNAQDYSSKDIDFANKHLRILSGLYGILRPLDLMQAYRLEMGTSFVCNGHKNLYSFWKPKLTAYINKELVVHKNKTIINCASKEYFSALELGALSGNVITPVFKEKKGDGYKIVSFFAKKARGMMASYIIENQIEEPIDIKAFTVDGYKYNKALSSDIDWVFVR